MYNISNRRYTGSKYKLLEWIEELILEKRNNKKEARKERLYKGSYK